MDNIDKEQLKTMINNMKVALTDNFYKSLQIIESFETTLGIEQDIIEDDVEKQAVVEAPTETPVDAAPELEPLVENVEPNVEAPTETPAEEEPKLEPLVENAAPEVEVPAEKATEETPAEEVVEQPPVIAPIPQPSVEAPSETPVVEEQQPVIPDAKDNTESQTPVVEENAAPEVEAPLIPVQPEEKESTVDASLPSLDADQPASNLNNSGYSYKETEGEAKAILVTQAQASQLRSSYATQDALIKNINAEEQNVNTDNNVSKPNSINELLPEEPKTPEDLQQMLEQAVELSKSDDPAKKQEAESLMERYYKIKEEQGVTISA